MVKRVSGSGSLTLIVYLVVDVLLIVTNPPQYVTNKVDFLGEPIGDLSDDIRLYLTEETTRGSIKSNITWETSEDICSFSWGWSTEVGVFSDIFYQSEHHLCSNTLSIDYYSLEGINTLSPYGVGTTCPSIDDLRNGSDSHIYIVNEDNDDNYMVVEIEDVGYRRITAFCYLEDVEFSTDVDGLETWVDNRETLDFYQLRHTYYFTTNLDFLGLPEGSTSLDVEVLFQTSKIIGVYEIADISMTCEQPNNTFPFEVECKCRFKFYPDRLEFININSDVRSEILQELDALVSDNTIIPDNLSKVGMEEGLRRQLGEDGELEAFDISCTAAYPYPSSTCIGTYELKIENDIHNRGIIILAMVGFVVVLYLMLSTFRIGMLNDRSSRGYLGPGGSCQYFFEEEEDDLNQPNPNPSIRLVRVYPDGGISETRFTSRFGGGEYCPMEEPGSSVPKEESAPHMKITPEMDKTSSCLGIVVRTGCGVIPVKLFKYMFPTCFIVMEDVDGSIVNLDMEEVHRIMDKGCGRALEDESSGGDHLGWARGFSIVDAGGCLLTLWTVHYLASNSGWGSFYWVAALVAISRWLEESDIVSFIGLFSNASVSVLPKNRHSVAPPLPITLAVMEVLYDLEIPGMGAIGLIFTIMWSLFIVLSCGYLIFVLGYEPIYDGGGLVSSKVSLKTAISVCTTMGTPLALAGDWVRKSRGGDIWGRLAFPLCLAMPSNHSGTRIGRVSHRSELYPTSLERGVVCG